MGQRRSELRFSTPWTVNGHGGVIAFVQRLSRVGTERPAQRCLSLDMSAIGPSRPCLKNSCPQCPEGGQTRTDANDPHQTSRACRSCDSFLILDVASPKLISALSFSMISKGVFLLNRRKLLFLDAALPFGCASRFICRPGVAFVLPEYWDDLRLFEDGTGLVGVSVSSRQADQLFLGLSFRKPKWNGLTELCIPEPPLAVGSGRARETPFARQSIEETRFHDACWRCARMVAWRERTTAGDAGDRVS